MVGVRLARCVSACVPWPSKTGWQKKTFQAPESFADQAGESLAGVCGTRQARACVRDIQGQGLAGLQHSVIALAQQQHPPWGSSPRPQGQEPCALPTEIGGLLLGGEI